MDLSQRLADAIVKTLHTGRYSSADSDFHVVSISADDSFLANHGFTGSEIHGVDVTIAAGGIEGTVRLVVKRWSPHQWVRDLTGVTDWLELLLYESGAIAAINEIAGVRIPTIGSLKTDDGEWIIMEDVSAQMASWMSRTEDEPEFFWRPTSECMPL